MSNLCMGGGGQFVDRAAVAEVITPNGTVSWKPVPHIDVVEAVSDVVRAAEMGAINSSDIVPVFKEFKNPSHEEFSEPTRWSLLNAFTETIKKYTPLRVDHSYAALNKCFGLDGNRPELWK